MRVGAGSVSSTVLSRRWTILLTLLLAAPAMGAEDVADAPPAPGFNAIWANDTGGAWAAGDAGVVAETTDGGRTWHRLHAPTTTSLRAVWRSPAGALFVAGARGVVLRGDREGRSWRPLRVHRKILSGLQYDQTPAGPRFRGIWGNDRSVYLVAGEPGAGAAICLVAPVAATVLDTTFPCQVDDPVGVWGHGQHLFVQGRIYDCHSGDYSVLDRSTDGGQTWERLPPTWSELPAPYWLTAGGASYELGTAGVIAWRQDGLHADKPATALETGRQHDHRAIWANDQGEIYVVGEGYIILHSRDHGKSFTETKVAVPARPGKRSR